MTGPTGPTRTAVVTLVHGRHDHLELQHRSLAAGTVRPDLYLVVAMDDDRILPCTVGGLRRDVVALGPDPRGLPLAAARNVGVEAALAAGAEVVVLLDVDCLAGPGLVAAYAAAVRAEPSVVWSGPVTYLPPAPGAGYDLAGLSALDDPHPARPAPPPGVREAQSDPNLFWSLSFALAPAAWRRAGGFCEEYVGYGGEDTDFARAVVASGLGLGWDGSARAYHQHHDVERPPTRHVADIVRNGRLFADRWGTWPMAGWLRQFEELGLVERVADGWVAAPRRVARPSVDRVLVVVPAHDEEDHIAACLASIRVSVAALRDARPTIDARCVVVLDRCRDRTAEIAGGFDVDAIEVAAGSVGGARRRGVAHAADSCPGLDPASVLIANTDADCVVPASWLLDLLDCAQDHDLVQGEVHPDPADLAPATLALWHARNPPGRGSLHGANLAVRLDAYLDVGGFVEVDAHEDLQLVRSLKARGYAAVCGGSPVQTSGRRSGRAPGGFAAYVRELESTLEAGEG